MEKIVVYGTLKKGKSNHSLLIDSKFLGETKIEGVSLYRKEAFPFAWKSDSFCFGELYEVDDNTLSKLDRLEGHPNWYKRELMEVINLASNTKETAWIYLNPDALKYKIIEGGVWE